MTSAAGPRGRGRPAQLSRERIVEAAATFDNVDALTMRELAARLEVRHGALYRWVSNRDELFDLISEVLVDRVLDESTDGAADWREELRRLAWSIHDRFLALPGYASHLARPHAHNPHSVDRLRGVGTALFARAGADAELAEQSWYAFITSMIGWLAVEEQPAPPGQAPPRFELFVEILLRGLPARELDG